MNESHTLDAVSGQPFRCTSCGRTDLPAAGDWDPPMCLECDAAINFDADMEHVWHEEQAAAEDEQEEVEDSLYDDD